MKEAVKFVKIERPTSGRYSRHVKTYKASSFSDNRNNNNSYFYTYYWFCGSPGVKVIVNSKRYVIGLINLELLLFKFVKLTTYGSLSTILPFFPMTALAGRNSKCLYTCE